MELGMSLHIIPVYSISCCMASAKTLYARLVPCSNCPSLSSPVHKSVTHASAMQLPWYVQANCTSTSWRIHWNKCQKYKLTHRLLMSYDSSVVVKTDEQYTAIMCTLECSLLTIHVMSEPVIRLQGLSSLTIWSLNQAHTFQDTSISYSYLSTVLTAQPPYLFLLAGSTLILTEIADCSF